MHAAVARRLNAAPCAHCGGSTGDKWGEIVCLSCSRVPGGRQPPPETALAPGEAEHLNAVSRTDDQAKAGAHAKALAENAMERKWREVFSMAEQGYTEELTRAVIGVQRRAWNRWKALLLQQGRWPW